MMNGKIELLKKFTLIWSTQQQYMDIGSIMTTFAILLPVHGWLHTNTISIPDGWSNHSRNRGGGASADTCHSTSSGLINNKERLYTKYIILSRAKYINLLTRAPFHMTGVHCHYVTWAILTFQ